MNNKKHCQIISKEEFLEGHFLIALFDIILSEEKVPLQRNILTDFDT